MLSYCRKHRGKVTHVVFADLSRLARNVADQSVTLATFKQLGITPVSCDETIDDSAAGKMSTNLLGVVNQFYSDSLSERIRFRMSAGVQQGRWLWLAPIGYLNSKEGLQVDPKRSELIREAFELVASRAYTLEEILRRLKLLGLTTRRGRPLTKQTLSRLLRNQIYAGWVVSGEHKIKGQHQPLVSQELFDAVQDALDGKVAAPIKHKKLNEDFPLKGFVLCTGCNKPLTAGWVKGRKEKYARYWCWNSKCSVRVSESRDMVEKCFVDILGMMEPTQELLNQLPEIAKRHWVHRLEHITNERRRLSNRLAEIKTLNQRILLQKVNGELSVEDFATVKETVMQQKADAEAQLNVLDAETVTMQGLLEDTQRNFVNLYQAWVKGTVQQRQELAWSLYPEGLVYSRETHYFEPRNVLLMNAWGEMWQQIADQKIIGAGDGI